MLICLTCDSILEDDQKECKKCGGVSQTYIPPFFLSNFASVESSTKVASKWKKPSEIRKNSIRKENIPGYDMFGQLPLHLRILLFGRYGSGKSSFALKLAESISSVSWRGTTIYVCAEEGSESATMQQKLEEQNIESDSIVFVDTLEDMLMAIRELNARNVVVDSINRLHLNVTQVTELYDKIKGIFILVAHSTKALDFKGESGFAHDADIVAMMDRGNLSFEKNRFNSISKTYRVWKAESDERTGDEDRDRNGNESK